MECHLEGLLLDGESLMPTQDYTQLAKKSEYKDGIWHLVEIDLNKLDTKIRRRRFLHQKQRQRTLRLPKEILLKKFHGSYLSV